MTENEAIKEIERHIQFLSENWKPHPDYNVIEALKEAIYALDKLEQYRAIGTVEEFKALKENSFFNFDSPLVRVDKKSYDKAIDEFAEKCITELIQYDCPLDMGDIEKIAEQLKAGEKNENNN